MWLVVWPISDYLDFNLVMRYHIYGVQMIWDCTCTTEVFFFYQQRINFKLRGYKRGIQPFTQPKLYFLLTLRDHHYIFKTTMMHNFGDPRLHKHRYRLFTDRRSCWSRWWCIPSATTDYAMLYRLAIILAFHVSSSTSPLTSNDLLFFKDGDDSQIRRWFINV